MGAYSVSYTACDSLQSSVTSIVRRLVVAVGHGLAGIAVAYLAWGLVVTHRYARAFAATSVGDPMSAVIARFGPPDNLESPLRFSHPEDCANGRPQCSDAYFLRLWYVLPFTPLIGGHVLIVDFNEQQRVIGKGDMRSP